MSLGMRMQSLSLFKEIELRKRQMKRFIVTMAGLIIALLLLVIWNVTSGSVSVDGMQMWQVLLRQTREGTFYHIVWDIRMPRLLAALFLGGALAVSGFLLQTFFQNPIAGPYVLGISSGAKMLVAVAMILCLERGMQISSLGMVAAAFIGSLLAMGFVLLLSMRVQKMSLLVVCGIMIGYICSAITDFMVTFASDSNIVNLHNWSMGSFSGTDLEGCGHDRRLSHTYGLSHLFYGKTDRGLPDGRSIRQKHGRQHSSAPHPFDSFIQPFVRLCDSLCGTYFLCGDCRSASGQAGDENGKTALSDPGLFFGRSGRDPFL